MVLGHEHLISNTNLDFYKLYKPKLQRQLGCLETVLFEYVDNAFLGLYDWAQMFRFHHQLIVKKSRR